ncbi:prealbumin-like fold domain-containing protein [Photobacterium sp. SDRW27]|uniref:MSCRAMM family protein n=1 Tax=Photobacterium obscurum TaxID=2829490 RepID=UPI002244CD2D|nr:prealbumin-like fold domain-containing protein [Photobacterium obscurum]MCW8329119.1 prealbumin-like fold domain-containing protein [Photobacterium obscurum]
MRVDFRLMKPLLALILLGVSQFSYAHQMRVFAFVEGKDVIGETYFVGGGKVASATIELIRNDSVLATATSDSDGNFVFKNVEADSYQIKADGGQGHQAKFAIDSSEFPFTATENKPSRVSSVEANNTAVNNGACNQPNNAELQQAIAHAIRPLRSQIEQYEAKTRFRDIAGGIGFIFGFFGLFVLVTRKKA